MIPFGMTLKWYSELPVVKAVFSLILFRPIQPYSLRVLVGDGGEGSSSSNSSFLHFSINSLAFYLCNASYLSNRSSACTPICSSSTNHIVTDYSTLQR